MDELQTPPQSAESSAGGRTPTASIGMPVFNGAKYIREALDALLNQTFTDFELIISDNASTDATGEICEEYAHRDRRIRYVRQPRNLGPIANFQYVLSKAQGRYFMWAACDDRWASTFLERTAAILEGDPGCGLAFCNVIERNLESGEEKLHRITPSNHESAIYNYITRTAHMCPSLIYGLFRVEGMKNMEFTSFDFAEVHFVADVALRMRIRVLDEYLYVAGTKGVREPYSLTHDKTNRTVFLHKQYELLKKHYPFPVAQCLFLLVCLAMVRHKAKYWRY